MVAYLIWDQNVEGSIPFTSLGRVYLNKNKKAFHNESPFNRNKSFLFSKEVNPDKRELWIKRDLAGINPELNSYALPIYIFFST